MKRLTSVFGNGGARFARVWSIASVSSLLATAVWSQSLTWLGTLGGDDSVALSVSADGSVVGESRDAAGQVRAFRWTQATGMQDLTPPGYTQSHANEISADGRVVVGWGIQPDGQRRALRWTATGEVQDLGTLPGYRDHTAFAVSGYGSVVVGFARTPDGRTRAFRWTASGGMQDLGSLGSGWSRALGVSDDGLVIVGGSINAENQYRAFRWENGVMQDLGWLGNGSEANAASADGSVVVGSSFNREGYVRAFRWTADDGMVDLGTLSGYANSAAWDVSDDGSVVVGYFYNGQNEIRQRRALRWTASGGMEDLNRTYARLLTDGSALLSAYGLSPDGRYIVGRGFNAATGRTEAYLLDTRCVVPADVNDDGAVNDADLLQVLFNFGTGCNN